MPGFSDDSDELFRPPSRPYRGAIPAALAPGRFGAQEVRAALDSR